MIMCKAVNVVQNSEEKPEMRLKKQDVSQALNHILSLTHPPLVRRDKHFPFTSEVIKLEPSFKMLSLNPPLKQS